MSKKTYDMKAYITIIFILYTFFAQCQCSTFQVYESFSTVLPTQVGTWVPTSILYGTTASTARTGSNYLTFNAVNDAMRLPQISNPGVFTFWYRRSSTSTGTPKFTVQTSPNGTTWTDRLSVTSFSTTYQQATVNLGALGLTNVFIRIIDQRASGNAERYVDDVSLTSTDATVNTLIPFLSACSQTLDAYTYTITDNIGPQGPINGNYTNNINRTVTLTPSDVTRKLNLTFEHLDLETDYDYLYVYDGANTSAPLLATLTGEITPSDITATNSTGQLTLRWTTDVSNVGSWGGFKATVNAIIALPVELLYFEGEAYPTFNKLTWATASEHISDYFEIHESLDGITWKHIGSRPAAGFSSQKINYSLLASFSGFGIYYYRLKQVDFDGNYKIYGPISVVNIDLSPKTITGYYDLTGKRLSIEGYSGIYIVIYDDGSIEKRMK
jgi:hypothetical protein